MGTAGITLMRGDVGLVAQAIDISSRTVAKIRQNLFWAFAYNVAGIPLAAMGYLSPVVAGAAMALSSVSVMTNALLLRRGHSNPHHLTPSPPTPLPEGEGRGV
jgi:Cu+-exporting ATPase